MADQLRDLIRDGAYAPGERLVERSIARELGTSHIPVREALARLAEEGLVVRLPRRGARVAELSPRMLEEISSVRVVLDWVFTIAGAVVIVFALKERAQPFSREAPVRAVAIFDE